MLDLSAPPRMPLAAAGVALMIVFGLVARADAQVREPPTVPLVVDSCKSVADGALCTDRNPCTVGDACLNGVCVGTIAADGTPCTDDNQCTVGDVCQTGVCTGVAVADGTPCTDGEVCTDPDACLNGLCVPGPTLQCDDGDPCTRDTCAPGDGCHYEPIPMCSDAGVDATPADGGGADGPPDAGPGEDALDDGAVDLSKLYEAQGGACVCTAAATPRSGTALGLLIAAAALSLRRRRR